MITREVGRNTDIRLLLSNTTSHKKIIKKTFNDIA